MEMFHKVDVLKYIIQIRHKLAQLKESRSPTKVFFPSEAENLERERQFLASLY